MPQALLRPLYQMEEEAIHQTLKRHGPAFVQAYADFADNLKTGFDRIFEMSGTEQNEER